MGAENFVANNYLSLAGLNILIAVLTVVLLKKHLAVSNQLKEQKAENKKLSALVAEYETDYTEALDHLNTANNKAMKRQSIAHAKLKNELRERHESELKEQQYVHAKALQDIKTAHVSTQARIKEGYQLAIHKRQYQFESKREQYAKLFMLLDQFENDNDLRMHEKIFPILNEFQKNYLQALTHSNKKKADNAITVVSKRLQRMVFDADQELVKIREQMNVVRLIAGASALQKLDELSVMYDEYMVALSKMMNEFVPSILKQKTDTIVQNEDDLDAAASAIMPVKTAFINLTREEVCEA